MPVLAGRPALVLAVAAAHALALWLLATASRPHRPPAGAAPRIVMAMSFVPPPLSAVPVARAAPERSASAAKTASGPRVGSRRAAPAAPRGGDAAASTAPPEAPRAASRPLDLRIGHGGTATLAPSFAERANQDLQRPDGPAAAPWRSGIAAAARGDCLRGEFKGGGRGLLSLPALALAAANGECAR